MPQSPNKITQFWQELKRRKVVRVITVYAAAAFVILELTDIVAPSLGLPDWTLNFIIILLIVGFIIAIILSWIYDVNPEGGIEKTEPADKVKTEDKPISSKGWKIASYISFVVIIFLIIFNIIPRRGLFSDRGSPDRSIAVLPFRNDSPEEEKMGFIEGTMEQILDNLIRIENLRVVPSTTVEQYRDKTKTVSMIAREMDVGYLLGGSGQRDGDQIRITVKLMDISKDRYIWSQTYPREIEDVFDMQSEVARSATRDIESIINPNADQIRRESTPERQAALIVYQEGLMEMGRYWESQYNIEFLKYAERLFHSSLEIDSTFIEAYEQLAQLYIEMAKKRFTERLALRDSAFFMAERAIQMGSEDVETHILIGQILENLNQDRKALDAYEKALSYDPQNSRVYRKMAGIISDTDPIEALELLFEAYEQGPPSAGIIRGISYELRTNGFEELSRYYLDEALKLDGDSLEYYNNLVMVGFTFMDYQSAREIGLKMLKIDSLERSFYQTIAISYYAEQQYDSSLIYFRKMQSLGPGVYSQSMIGYVLVQNGEIEEGEKYITEQFELRQTQLERGQLTKSRYLNLGELYSYKGEKDNAIKYLKIFTQQKGIDFFNLATLLKSPLLDNIRNEPEFKEIKAKVESIVQAKHERVRQWLEENDRL